MAEKQDWQLSGEQLTRAWAGQPDLGSAKPLVVVALAAAMQYDAAMWPDVEAIVDGLKIALDEVEERDDGPLKAQLKGYLEAVKRLEARHRQVQGGQ